MEIAYITLSQYFRNQFVVNADSELLQPYIDASIVTFDGTIKNSDRIVEVCQGLAEKAQIYFSEEASKLFAKFRDESDIHSQSLSLPFELKNFQKRGLHSLDGEKDVMFVCSCGTGKTAMGTVFAIREFDRGNVSKIVIFCPAPLISQWVEWLNKSTNLTVGTVNRRQSLSKRQAWYQTDQSDIWVINYDRTNTKDWSYIEKNLAGEKLLFVFDEVQRLKNRKRARHAKFRKLVDKLNVKYKCGLTATPLERSPEDFYNEWRIIDPSVYGTVKNFEHLFTFSDGEKDMFNQYLGFKNLDYMGLMSASQTFIAEKTNPEIAKEFPERQEIVIDIDLSPIERKLYDEIYSYGKLVSDMDKELDIMTKQGVLFMLMFQRICRMPEVLLNNECWKYDGDNPYYAKQLNDIQKIVEKYKDDLIDSKESEKLKKTEELVDQIISSDEKLIIFAQHTNNCLIPLANHLKKYKPLIYTGEQTTKEKGAIANAFRTSKDHNLLLMSDAGKEGVDLPEGRYLIHYDTPPTYSAYTQRSDRIHRISSRHNCVTIYRFKTKDTIEERIEEVMEGRRQLAQTIGIGEYEVAGENDIMNDMDYILGF